MASPVNPPPPPQPGQRAGWCDLPDGAVALAAARAARRHPSLTLLVTPDTQSYLARAGELRFYAGRDLPILSLPDWETLPYDVFSPHQDITSERLQCLNHLHNRGGSDPALLVVPVNTLLQRLSPTAFIDRHSLALKRDQRFDPLRQRERLEAAGYHHVATVTERGEYAQRGSIMDIFPMGAVLPIRIDLDDDRIETLRSFDPDSQRTIEHIDALALLPAREFPMDAEAIAGFRQRWHHTFDADVRRCSVYQDVSAGLAPSGVEYFLPLFFERLSSLFDYLGDDTLVILDQGSEQAIDTFWGTLRARYESLRHDVERPILTPEDLYLRTEELFERLKPLARIDVNGYEKHAHRFTARALPDLTANSRVKEPAARVRDFCAGYDGRVLFVAESAGRREILLDFLAKVSLLPDEVADFDAFLGGRERLGVAIADVHVGFRDDDVSVITQSCLFGRVNEDERNRRARQLDPDQIVRNLTELRPGAPVVHVEHGVGRYRGLETLNIDDADYEFVTLEYADGARLYVPVASLHLISRYAGSDDEHAPLHRLGSDQWEKARKRAAEKACDVAAELLDIYARRESRKGPKLDPPDEEYERFAMQFPFEMTPDQKVAVDAVISDLCSDQPTDRLICGDVGFGKTEVAMRAAFLAVQSNRQVVVLVPTTLLAQQHHDTFRDRFADWPVRIEAVSRLKSNGEVAAIRDRLRRRQVDIVIGTHKLLSARFRYSDLGLIIIDEEHRFGVRQKERLKALRAEVDVLTLTATPIPRTLNMALSGIRDLSIIATPPAKRLSIRTFIHEKRNHLIKEAIIRELTRGGQVFYLHNEVRTIDQTADELSQMVPQARIGIGHGQMKKRDLERTMNDFYHRQINVLVCTTIIETGIDVPNANTIIIERADRFGLAQLHQLRGRVGRSHRQAYAYLLTPERRAMTTDAMKRLEAIEAAGELGVGFTLATHDMEIRGAGELLGEDQSGQIESIGFNLYMDLLERAVNSIRSGRQPDLDQPIETSSFEVNLHAPALIPDDYLPDVHTRLIFYKRISAAASGAALDDLQVEMIDRFGLPPEPLKRLFRITELKLQIQALGINRVDVGAATGRVEFAPTTRVSGVAVVRIVQEEPDVYRLDGASVLRFRRSLPTFEGRLAFARDLVAALGVRLEQAASA